MVESREYFARLKHGLDRAYAVASDARKKYFDPTGDVEVKLARDVAARVEGIVGPPGIADRIREMEKSGMQRADIAFEIAKEIASGKVIKANKEFLIEQAVRTGVGILTEGVLVAPTEGISKVRINQNPDGSDYVAIYYAGPIRSAGGTAAALTLLLADIARKEVGVGDYRATDSQIERYIEEVNTYESRVTHLQYLPPEKDIREIAKNIPVCINGDPTEEIEVSAYRGIPGVETDRVRGGVPLVLCEGVALKAAKVFKYAKKLGLGWEWLQNIIKIKQSAGNIEVKPDPSYLDGLVAGRPVFSYPSEKGGFRLRYGRSRTNGIMGKNIHPAAMVILDSFLAYGTHMKIERPGKGCVVAGHEGIEPPVVRLRDGRVMKVRTIEEAEQIKDNVEKILFLGDILSTYGDFVKSNHPLLPSGFCTEWWLEEIEEKGIRKPSISDAPSTFSFSKTHGVPLHPDYTFPWHDITASDVKQLAYWLKESVLQWDGGQLKLLSGPVSKEKGILESLLVEHRVGDGKVLINGDSAHALLLSLGILDGNSISLRRFDSVWNENKEVMELIKELSGVLIKKWAPTYIGARMGRPEKAKERKMDGSPNILFPTGSFKNRSLSKIYRSMKGTDSTGAIKIEVSRFRCTSCRALTFSRKCDACGGRAVEEKICQKCGRAVKTDIHCDRKTVPYDKRSVDLLELFDKTKSRLGFMPEEVKGVRGLSNAERIPERLEKGFLRSRYGVYVFRDGTSRFDATDVPLTHFKPSEIGIAVAKAKELGYTRDYLGKPLENGDQLVPLACQDVVLSESGAEYFIKVANFIDDMLVNLYGLKPFYNVKRKEDLVGHLFVGLSPHTSAGVLCRAIGFSNANVGYAHPYFHTAKRRNCFHGDTTVPVFRNGGWEIAKLKDFVENNMNGSRKRDAFGTEFSRVKNIKTLALNKETGRFELAEVTHVSKHPSQDHLIDIKTKSGRRIRVTKEHPFPNVGQKKMAMELSGVHVPFRFNIEANDIPLFDIAGFSKDVMVKSRENPFRNKNMRELAKKLRMNYKTLTNYVYRNSYPLHLLESLGIKSVYYRKVAAKRDSVLVNRFIKTDEDLMFLLGIYLADGYSRKKDKMHYQVCIAAAKSIDRKKIASIARRVFGIKPRIDDAQVVISSRLVYLFFNGLGLGRGARDKRIPSFLLSMPKEKIAAFLKGFFTGDGSSSLGSTLEVNATSVNKELLLQISFLLNRFGIAHSFDENKRFIESKKILDFYGKPKFLHSYKVRMYGEDAAAFIKNVGFSFSKEKKAKNELHKWNKKRRATRRKKTGDVFSDPVVSKSIVRSEDDYVYSLTVSPHHTVVASGMVSHQCDGDEDSLMILLDSLINFSKKYLDEKRGGTMDAPLVLTIELNPSEVDDEVHCLEFVSSYPLEFYRVAEKISSPGSVKIKRVKDVLGSDEQYDAIPITHPGGYLDKGVLRTAYVQLQSIPEKIDEEFRLHEKIRAVDEADAAERLILSHFIPDLYGNLRSFSRQTFRCVNCNHIYRRVPLAGKCTRCGGNLLLTINKGGIEKYLKISNDIVEKYHLPTYLKQRLELLEKEINNIFEDEKIKQTGLADYL